MYATAFYLILILTTALAGPALAETEPSLAEVYETARTGHVERAQEMMNEVLRDHPRSAKAHYVRAQLYAMEGNLARGRQELNTAQTLEPGLSFATPESVRALQSELSHSVQVRPAGVQTGSSFGWQAPVIVVVAGVILWFLFARRRSVGSAYSQPRDAMTPSAAAPPGTAGVPGASPSVGATVGTGVAGGLASGLAAGAGIVAGEAIARHLLDPGRSEDNTPLTSEPVESDDPVEPDFGVSGGNSWDDDAPAPDDGGGADDWS